MGESHQFWYPRSVDGGTEFILGDAGAGSKRLAFDHEKLAAAISAVAGQSYKSLALPFAPPPGSATAPLTFLDGGKALQFGTGGSLYKCWLTTCTCTKEGPVPVETRLMGWNIPGQNHGVGMR